LVKYLIDLEYEALSKKIVFNVGLGENSVIEYVTVLMLKELLKNSGNQREGNIFNSDIELFF
jgi:hypothetical protein